MQLKLFLVLSFVFIEIAYVESGKTFFLLLILSFLLFVCFRGIGGSENTRLELQSPLKVISAGTACLFT